MKKWFSLFFVLLVIALTGCQTYRGDGAAAGAGTYPLKTSPASDDTVLITVVDSSKAGGFDIRRTPMANIPVSTPVQTALNLKQDASTAVTADDVRDAIDEAIAGVDGSTITADTTDPTKAAAAVLADTATVATTAGSATIADSATELTPTKVSGVPGFSGVFGGTGSLTGIKGEIGPTASFSNNYFEQWNGSGPAYGQVKVYGTPQLVEASGSVPAHYLWPYSFADQSGGAAIPGGTNTNDILYWSSGAWTPIALEDHPAFAGLLAAFSASGLNSFSFTPNNTFPLWIDGDGVTLSVDVTDTSTTYAVDTVSYQLDGAGGFVNALANTTGDTWTAAFDPDTDGTYTVQYQAGDDKSVPNTGNSSVYTIYRDATAPSVEAGANTTHDGTGTAVVFAPTISDTNLVSKSYRVTSEDGNTVVTDWTVFTTSTVDVTLPSTTSNYRIYARGTDHLQSTDDYLVASYSAGASIPTQYWSLDDNASSTTVLSNDGNNGTLAGSVNSSTIHSTDHIEGSGSFLFSGYFTAIYNTAVKTAVETGVFTVQYAVKTDMDGSPTAYPGFITDSNSAWSIWQPSATQIRIRCGSTNYNFTCTDVRDGNWHTVTAKFNRGAGSNELVVYEKVGSGSTVSIGSVTTIASVGTLGTGVLIYGDGGGDNWGGYCDRMALWDTAVTP